MKVKSVLDKLGVYAKAVVAAAVAGSGALTVALQDGVLTGPEKLNIALALVAALGVVAKVSNKPKAEEK